MGTCWWVTVESEAYHELEWNVLVDDDRRFYEYITLEILQAGLSWRLIMQRREALRKILHDFNPAWLARLSDDELERLRGAEGMIRHAGKLKALRANARVFLTRIHGTSFLKRACGIGLDQPVEAYDPLFKDFTFFGPTMRREFLESSGIISKEHDEECFFHALREPEAKRIIRDREEVYGERLVRHDATLRKRFPHLTMREKPC